MIDKEVLDRILSLEDRCQKLEDRVEVLEKENKAQADRFEAAKKVLRDY